MSLGLAELYTPGIFNPVNEGRVSNGESYAGEKFREKTMVGTTDLFCAKQVGHACGRNAQYAWTQ